MKCLTWSNGVSQKALLHVYCFHHKHHLYSCPWKKDVDGRESETKVANTSSVHVTIARFTHVTVTSSSWIHEIGSNWNRSTIVTLISTSFLSNSTEDSQPKVAQASSSAAAPKCCQTISCTKSHKVANGSKNGTLQWHQIARCQTCFFSPSFVVDTVCLKAALLPCCTAKWCHGPGQT